MYWFAIKRTLKLGVKSLWMHKLRSILTMLGIVFGVCSVIAMLAIGEGASKQAQEAIAKLGSTNIIIETVEPPDEKAQNNNTQQGVRAYGLTYADAEAIRNTIPNVEVAVPIREIDHEARYDVHKASVKVIGTIPWYTEIFPLRVYRGRFICSSDMYHQQSVCVIDESVARGLFLFDDPLNQYVRIMGNFYKVVGIVDGFNAADAQAAIAGTKSAGIAENSGGFKGNIYLPLTTAKTRFSELSATFSAGSQKISKIELQKITVKVDSSDTVLVVRDILDTLLGRMHEKNDYRIIVPLELLRQAAHTRRIFSIVLGSIAAISLLVGGIGIMNIMLATVSERTREIGIRRALGAQKRDIIVQFLSETLLLTFVGGIIGMLLGSIIPALVSYFGNMPTVITPLSLILSFGISGLVGVIFGIYPAWRAANMDPIESLRHE